MTQGSGANVKPLAGRVAIVTGGGWNVGRGIAEAFAAAGAHTVVAARDAGRLAETASAIRAAGGSATATPTDAADAARVDALVAEVVHAHGRLDVFAAIAGGGCPGRPLDELSAAEWDAVFRQNTTTAFLAARAALPVFRRAGRGTLLLCSGGGAHHPVPGAHLNAYACAKAAVCRLTDQLTAELWDTEIRVHCLDPGMVWSPATRLRIEAWEAENGVPHPDRAHARTAAEAGELAVWLASDESAPIRGRIVSVRDSWWRDPQRRAEVHASDRLYRLWRTEE